MFTKTARQSLTFNPNKNKSVFFRQSSKNDKTDFNRKEAPLANTEFNTLTSEQYRYLPKDYHFPYEEIDQNLLDNSVLKTKNINMTVKDNIAVVTICVTDKPQNIITRAVLSDLKNAMDIAIQLKVYLFILRSGREGMFVVGADVNEFAYASSVAEIESFSALAQTVYSYMAINNGIKTLCIINGYVLGGGQELAMTADYCIGSSNVQFGLVEVTLGVIPAFDGFKNLINLLGPVEAARHIVSGHMINAEQAYKIGLLDKIVTTKEDMGHFINDILHGRIVPKPKVQLKSFKDYEEPLEELKDLVITLSIKQEIALKNLNQRLSISQESIPPIRTWLEGVTNGRLAALNVINEQLKTDNPFEKSRIEREAFSKLALTKEAKFATKFWLLEKKKYRNEHAIIHEELIKNNLFYIPSDFKIKSCGIRSICYEKPNETAPSYSARI